MKNLITVALLALILVSSCSKKTETASNNPLLNEFSTPHQTLPFDSIKTEHLLPAAMAKLESLQEELKRISTIEEAPTFENTILPIDIEVDNLLSTLLVIANLNAANNNDEIQEVMEDVEGKLTFAMGKIIFNKKLIHRVKTVYDNRDKLENNAQKAATEELYVLFKDFIELGFFKKLKYAILQMKGSSLSSKFSKNLQDEANAYELHIQDSLELDGIPALAIETAAELAHEKEKEGWIFTLHQPSFTPVITYAKNRAIREEIYKAYVTRGNHNDERDNKELIEKTIKLRIKTAQLLGYENYAHQKLTERMVSSPQEVENFINSLTTAVRPFAEKEIQEIKAYMKSEGIEGEPSHWDYIFYTEKLKEERYGYTKEETRPYFELGNVTQGIFDLATSLYGITFQRNNDIQVYHQDVEAYEVFDEDKSYLGVLYLDFFPREGKNGGAWNTIFSSQKIRDGKNIRPHTSIVCNFSKPTKDTPALLTFNEMNTYLHEFGHALHQLFSQVDYTFISSGNVCWDFIELPSQIMENWATEKEWLDQWAKHYETGEKIPDELVNKIITSKNYFSGISQFNWLKLDHLDMAWHTITAFPEEGVDKFEKNAVSDYLLAPVMPEACISTRFSHIFAGGYASGYYGYHWANVLDADAFEEFKKHGVFNKTVATSFRKNILEKGASEDPMKLFIQFKGSEPTIDAMLERSGFTN